MATLTVITPEGGRISPERVREVARQACREHGLPEPVFHEVLRAVAELTPRQAAAIEADGVLVCQEENGHAL